MLDLGVVFICENKEFGEGSRDEYGSGCERIGEGGGGYNMGGVGVDGM
ncbi:thiamine pyrophosphate-dependent enzyme, partial [Staphylococcus epidermidis]